MLRLCFQVEMALATETKRYYWRIKIERAMSNRKFCSQNGRKTKMLCFLVFVY